MCAQKEWPPTGDASQNGPPASAILVDPEPLQLAVFVGDSVTVHPLPPAGSVSLGRSRENDVRIDDTSVSRRHAVLHLGPPLRIEDLGGTNGTYLRETRGPTETADTHDLRQLSGQTIEITLGDGINLGTTMIVVRRASAGLRAPAPHGSAPSAHAPVGAGDDRAGELRLPPIHASGAEVVVRDPTMQALHQQAQLAAQSMISVLLLGETGVGKEVLAQAIHRQSPRAARPFLALNCAALPEALLESELFGNEKGAFTGAGQARPGLFEAAEGGTVFLDEVGELPMTIQVKLLRVLEERMVLRVGGRAPRAVDVRFLSATNRDLEEDVARGSFRSDVFFRLNGIAITIPPLRERVTEIPHLAAAFVANACRQLDRRAVPALSAEALSLLERYAWPGNVRELRNAIDRAVVLCAGDALLPEHLPQKLRSPAPIRAEPRVPAPPESAPTLAIDPMAKLRLEMDALERQRILEALEQCAGNQTQAAERLGLSRRTLVTKLGAYNIPRPRKRP